MINVAKWALFTVLALPFLELAVFIVVAAVVGFSWALSLVLAGSALGSLILRHAGRIHIAQVRVALGQDNFTGLRAHQSGGFVLIAGILLLIPGFITQSDCHQRDGIRPTPGPAPRKSRQLPR